MEYLGQAWTDFILTISLAYIANSASQWCLRTINLYGSTSTNNTQAM